MGTNYYLIRKMEYVKGTPISLGCDSWDTEIEELTNGWVLRDTYYPTLEELSKNFSQEIHIGKSSFGWHFGLCIYPDYGINNLQDWINLFNNSSNKIMDEYGKEVSVNDMISIITERGRANWNNDPKTIKAFEEEILIHHNELMKSLGDPPCRSYDELLAQNHAERGVRGLWKHGKIDKFHVNNPIKNATYDYIISGNDPETGCIFS